MDDYLTTGGVQKNLEILSQPPTTGASKSTFHTKSPQSTAAFLPRDVKHKKEDLLLKGYGRQWGDKLTYSVGFAYGTGVSMGGTYGLLIGIRKKSPTPKLFLNSILNSCSIHGPFLANKCAVITMFYCGFNNLLQLINGEDKLIHSPISGALSGALFKCTSNFKLMGLYSVISSVVFGGVDYSFRQGYI